MPGKRKSKIYLYAAMDWAAAAMAWFLFFLGRKIWIEAQPSANWATYLNDIKFLTGMLLLPLGWLALYFLTNTYIDIYKKSRLSELGKTWMQTFFGCAVIFFIILLDDQISIYKDYYALLLLLLLLHGGITSVLRMSYLTISKRQLYNGKVGFNTLMIGGNSKATAIYKELQKQPAALGYRFMGFISVNDETPNGLAHIIPHLGSLEHLEQLISDLDIETVIIAIETSDHQHINEILNRLQDLDIAIKIIPDIYDIISGSVKMGDVLSAILIEIDQRLMPLWQFLIKRIIDVVVSLAVLVFLAPLFLFIMLRVRLSSKGPVFYRQERLGKFGRPFYMYKFRSMYMNSENEGPQLAEENDPRITPWGKVMRKYRMDELPQFFNVLIGDMSLVGPRPEREFYVDQLLFVAPHYKHLHKVRPGITSWGMVKYGYASSLDEMVERMKYDILYIENMSLALDFKILIYTVLTLVQGKGV